MKRFTIIFLLAMSLSSQAWATYTCTGPVTNLAISGPTGIVTATIGTIQWAYLCQVNGTYNGVSPEACKAIYAHLMTAKLTGKNEMLWFNDDATHNCTNHTPWAQLTGWYFGPDFQ